MCRACPVPAKAQQLAAVHNTNQHKCARNKRLQLQHVQDCYVCRLSTGLHCSCTHPPPAIPASRSSSLSFSTTPSHQCMQEHIQCAQTLLSNFLQLCCCCPEPPPALPARTPRYQQLPHSEAKAHPCHDVPPDTWLACPLPLRVSLVLPACFFIPSVSFLTTHTSGLGWVPHQRGPGVC